MVILFDLGVVGSEEPAEAFEEEKDREEPPVVLEDEAEEVIASATRVDLSVARSLKTVELQIFQVHFHP